MSKKILPHDFYFDDTASVAKNLLGKILCRRLPSGEVLRGRIVETEAYLGVIDRAAHTFGGRTTDRVRSMWLDGGHAYVFLIYGMYNCLNFVTRTIDHPEAVLIRAIEVETEKTPRMFQKGLPTNGPGKLCRYFQITREEDGLPLWKKKSDLWVEDAPPLTKKEIVITKRVGIDYAQEAIHWPLRFYIKDNPFISKK